MTAPTSPHNDTQQLDALTKAAFTFKPGHGGGCAEPVVNRDFIGKDPIVLAKAAGVNLPAGTQLLFAETDASHPFVIEEQMMPFVPIVRVKSVEEGIQRAKEAEHNYKHTAIIHSHDVEAMTAMGRALDTTVFIKNGPCMAGLGLGGEGFPRARRVDAHAGHLERRAAMQRVPTVAYGFDLGGVRDHLVAERHGAVLQDPPRQRRRRASLATGRGDSLRAGHQYESLSPLGPGQWKVLPSSL